MQQFDTYLFDFDGTLVDSEESIYHVFKGAYKAVGVDVKRSQILRLMRISLLQGYEELGAPQDDESKDIFKDEILRLLDDEEIIRYTKTYKEVKDVLLELRKRNKTIGIVTSNNKKHVGDVLRFVGLDENLFSVIVGNFETTKHKPDPDPILKALELLNISKENVCYVGDGLDDMRCAVNAEVYPVLLDRLNEYENESYFMIKNLKELLK